jgi:TniQ
MRRLALVTAAEPGESFASWIDRMAVDMSLPPGRVADAIGVSGTARAGDGTPLLFGVSLAPSVRAAVHTATGIQPATLDAMHLSAYDGTVLDLAGVGAAGWQAKVRRTQWALFGSSRACPRCLAESGGVWRLWWKLGAAVACTVHSTLLLDDCPACGVALRRGTASSARVLSRTLLVPPLTCGNRVDGRLMPKGCDQRLDSVATDAVPPWLIEVQAAYLRAADGATMMLGGSGRTGAEWFACLRAVVAMARAATAHLSLPRTWGCPTPCSSSSSPMPLSLGGSRRA